MAKYHFPFVQGNTKEGLQFTVKNQQTGAVIDITGSTVTFRVFSQDRQTLRFAKGCSLTDPSNGVCTYTPAVAATDFDTDGRYLGELEVLFSDGRYGRVQNSVIEINPKAPIT